MADSIHPTFHARGYCCRALPYGVSASDPSPTRTPPNSTEWDDSCGDFAHSLETGLAC